jgi:lipid II:glycine glycyltransferase (peptidoglycan interpeptide bridge formation enzyme)
MLNRYLHWSEIGRYRAEGIETYDLGGIGDGSNSIARFKLSFGGAVVREYNYVLASPLAAAGYRVKALIERCRTGLSYSKAF